MSATTINLTGHEIMDSALTVNAVLTSAVNRVGSEYDKLGCDDLKATTTEEVRSPDPDDLSAAVDGIVDSAMSDLSDQFKAMQVHLDTFLQAIRQHVIDPDSPSATSDVSDWDDLSRWPDIHRRRQSIPDSDSDIGSEISEVISPPRSPPVLDDAFALTPQLSKKRLDVFSEIERPEPTADDGLIKLVNRRAHPRRAIRDYVPDPLPTVPLPDDVIYRQMLDELQEMQFAPEQSTFNMVVNKDGRTRSSNHQLSQPNPQRSKAEFAVIKHGRRGRPKPKTLQIDTFMGVISWESGSILMTDVKQIRCGRQTTTLNRPHAAMAYEGLFASVITANRSLDLEFRSRPERNRVVGQVKDLIAAYLASETNRHLTWQLQQAPPLGDVSATAVAAERLSVAPLAAFPNIQSLKNIVRRVVLRRQSSPSWTIRHL